MKCASYNIQPFFSHLQPPSSKVQTMLCTAAIANRAQVLATGLTTPSASTRVDLKGFMSTIDGQDKSSVMALVSGESQVFQGKDTRGQARNHSAPTQASVASLCISDNDTKRS